MHTQAVVVDPDWGGRVKVTMDAEQVIKSYKPQEIELVKASKYQIGDRIRITKVGKQTGKTARH